MAARLAASLALACLVSAAAPADGVRPSAPPLAASGGFDFRGEDPANTRRQVSGIACPRPGVCLIVFDEGLEARHAELTETLYRADPRPVVLAEGSADDEVDAEAAATDGAHVYVVGSHALGRKKPKTEAEKAKAVVDRRGKQCLPHPLSRTLLRFDVDGTGHVARDARPARGELTPVIESRKPLADALGLCIRGGDGLDIEGLAFARDRLWFGFRGPTDGGEAYLLSADAAALFSGGDPKAGLDKVSVGKRRAIRDMQAVDGGLLILAGPDDDKDHEDEGWSFVFWDPGTKKSKLLGELAFDRRALRPEADGCRDEEFKPEAIYALDRGSGPYRVAVLSDGMCDGAPIWMDVPRP